MIPNLPVTRGPWCAAHAMWSVQGRGNQYLHLRPLARGGYSLYEGGWSSHTRCICSMAGLSAMRDADGRLLRLTNAQVKVNDD